MKLFTELYNIYNCIIKLLIGIGGALFLFSVVSISVSVFTRYFFGYSIFWVIEVSTYILLYIGVVTAPWILMQGEHISIDLLFYKFSKNIQKKLGFLISLSASVLFLLLSYYGVRTTWDMYVGGYFTDTMLEIPRFILVGIVSISFVLLFIEFALNSLRWIKANNPS